LRETYLNNADRLPKAGTPDEMSNPVVLGMIELGGAFCKKALEQESVAPRGQRFLFGDVNFKRGPEQFDDFLKGVVFDHLAMLFWQRGATDDEKAQLSQLATDATEAPADPADTVAVMQILCAAYSSSMTFLVK
jgi:hypothetical protein